MNRSRMFRRNAVTLLVALVPSTAAMAQATRDTMTTDTTKKLRTLFTYRDAALAAGFVGLTVAMFPVDKHIAAHLRDQSTPANRFFDRAATGVEVISSPGALVIARRSTPMAGSRIIPVSRTSAGTAPRPSSLDRA